MPLPGANQSSQLRQQVNSATQTMSNALSEKAKGKRRAIDVEPEGTSESGPSDAPTASQESNRTFTVRFSEGAPDLEMTVSPNDTVREVQRRVSTIV